MHIVLLGGPGSGKGTQADFLQSELNLTHISSGDMFRQHLKEQTALGRLAESYMSRGDLVPDEVTVAMIAERLRAPDVARGVIYDGFPRTPAQAEALDKLLAADGKKIDAVLYIHVPDEVIVERLSGRRICRECQTPFHLVYNPFKRCPYDKCQGEYLYQRNDDLPETVRARLQTYHHETAPLIDYYRQKGLLFTVPGEGSIEAVRGAILSAVEQVKR